jgi:uncharacterized repeat protein (TIGR03803 family)
MESHPSVDGNLYGVTGYGGLYGFGTLFSVSAGGILTTAYNFNWSNVGVSVIPNQLLQGTDGNLYATMLYGGRQTCGDGCGFVLEMSATEGLTVRHRFNGTGGAWPLGGLLEATNGSFYGTTSAGGSPWDGTVFRLDTGLAPFVRTLPHFGRVGDVVKVLGTDLTGATAVSFHGVSAAFTIASPTEISTTVPAGATTGEIRVTLPAGVLHSGGPFVVGS